MNPIKQPGGDLPDNLPLLTQVADEDESNDLPTLTEIIADETANHRLSDTHQEATPVPEAVAPVSRASDEEEMLQLLQRLETHIENVLTHKLNLNLEQLQRQAVEQAVNDLKAELPMLLREALNKRPGL